MPSDITDESAIEFQVYSSHHVTRRHLVGVAAISLRDIEHLENGLKEMTIMPQSVYRVSSNITWIWFSYLRKQLTWCYNYNFSGKWLDEWIELVIQADT